MFNSRILYTLQNKKKKTLYGMCNVVILTAYSYYDCWIDRMVYGITYTFIIRVNKLIQKKI